MAATASISMDPEPYLLNHSIETGGRAHKDEPKVNSDVPPTISPRADRQDPKQSLKHILTSPEPPVKSRNRAQEQVTPTSASKTETPTKQPIIWIDGGQDQVEDKEEQASVQNDSYTRAAEFNPSHTMTVAHTRRNANGTIGSVYSGNKIKHLKKEDGIPLWRKDIQLNFLQCVFSDDTKCFTKASAPEKGPVHTFADIYVDAMARSSKTSKILKEKLLADQDGAMHMAMICLLVNVGRMNTTLNFFPEMRAQLRTYHAIPSLQANQDPNAYKQLQDAPRLKSILKGASEDQDQPSTIDKIKALPVPRTNPVNLIFVLSQYAPKISEIHFPQPRDFFDLVMRATLSSKSRANNFLWLIWFYLESDFSPEMALENPFGPGQRGSEPDGLPFKVPPFEHLTEAQADAENVDTEEEKEYGEMKRQERIRILQDDETVGPPMKKAKKNPTTDDLNIIAISDGDPTRSPSPSSAVRLKPKHNEYDGPTIGVRGTLDMNGLTMGHFGAPMARNPSNPQRLVLKTHLDFPHSSSPAPPGSGHPILHSAGPNGIGSRRQRPETSHQRAVNMNRKMRIDHILHTQISAVHKDARLRKKNTSSSFGLMVMNRVKMLPEMYDTEDEGSWGPGGLVPGHGEHEDFGEEALVYKKSVDRALRRLERGENGALGGLVRGYRKRKRKSRGFADDEEKERRSRKRRKEEGSRDHNVERSRAGGHEDTLDDLDLDLLGEGRDDDDEMDEDSMDESEGSLTEDEAMNDR
ncbi:Ino eighty subunit 1, partial [Lecanoromycetidae sp. Uapishka_2]